MNLKKVFATVVAYVSLLCASGCSSEKQNDMPESYYKAGVKFIKTLDEAIDMEIDYETAYEETERYIDVMEEYSEEGNDEDEAELYNLSIISSKANLIRVKLTAPEYKLDELIEDRNELAEEFGIENME